MDIKVVLFDLDGTLLPMDQDIFVKNYFGLLAAKLQPHGYESEQLIKSIWTGTAEMVKNSGRNSNENIFWEKFSEIYGDKVMSDQYLFEEYYNNEFQKVQSVCGYNPDAVQAVKQIQQKGLRIALATNPIFPAIATESRIRWAGLSPEDFEFYTTYENSYYSKPNPQYYNELVKQLGVQPKECLMVGNDVTEDMIAETIGMKVFLITDCLINKNNEDISAYPHGNFKQLLHFVDNMFTFS